MIELLKEFDEHYKGKFTNVQTIWLLANRMERTVVAIKT
jgi:hypothetical protein